MQQHVDTNATTNLCVLRVRLLSQKDNAASITDARRRVRRKTYRPCIVCGTLSVARTRCVECEQRHQRARNAQRAHYKGDYQRRARAVRESAVLCALCGQPARPGDPMTADHIEPGVATSPLRAAHRSCNSARGNRV